MGWILVFVTIIQLILFLGHLLVYKTCIFFLHITSSQILWTLRIIFLALSLSFLTSTLISRGFNNIFTQYFYIFSASWLSFLNFLILASVLLWIVLGLLQTFHISFDRKLLAEIFFGLAIAVSVYGLINAATIQITKIEVKLPNLPKEWQNKTAVWVSDLHLGETNGYNFSKKVAEMIQEINPDIVFMGGDFYEDTKADRKKLIEPFAALKSTYGTYFITGNHEEFGDKSVFIKPIEEAGINVLDNEMVNLDGLQLIGVDYNATRDLKNYEKILDDLKIDPKIPSILLRHAPSLLEIAEKKGINLEISGHTHHAQIFPHQIFTYLIYKGYDYGLKKIGNMKVYTSSGVGTWGPPSRVGSKSEIVLIKFK